MDLPIGVTPLPMQMLAKQLITVEEFGLLLSKSVEDTIIHDITFLALYSQPTS
jgi:hypothetical protein